MQDPSANPLCPSLLALDPVHIGIWLFCFVLPPALGLLYARVRRKSLWWSCRADPFRRQNKRLRILRMGSWISHFTEMAFYYAQWVSPATWVFGTRAASHNDSSLKKEQPRRAKCVDVVMFIWIATCGLAFWAATTPDRWFVPSVVCALAALRIIDIVQAQINAHLWDVLRVKPRKREYVYSLQRSLILAAFNYGELWGWFTVLYRVFGLVRGADASSVVRPTEVAYFSAITQLTIGYGEFQPICEGRILAPLQTALGTMLLVVGVARLVAGIRPPSRR